MGRPFGPAWAPRNAQRANVGPAGLGSMVNVIALKTATLVLSRGWRSALPMSQLICRRTCEWLEIGYTYRAVRISYLVHLAEVAHIHTGYCKITTCYRARPDKRAQRVAFSSYMYIIASGASYLVCSMPALSIYIYNSVNAHIS